MIAQIDRNYMRYGIVRTVQRFLSYGLFEGRPVTTRGRFINPAVFAWLKVLAAFPGKPKVKQPVFITGLGRSGTTILGILFSLHKQVGYLNEPKAMWHVIDPRQDINGNYSDSGAFYRLDPLDVTPEISRRAHRIYARYLSTISADRVVDKYPELLFRIGYVQKIFPDAKFIFITRNGINAIPSIVKWSEQAVIKVGDDSDDWWGKKDIKWHYICEQLIRQDKSYEAVWQMSLEDMDHINRAALEWIITMREGMEQQRKFPAAVVRISYESILENPEKELEQLQLWCGLNPDSAVIDYARQHLYVKADMDWPQLDSRVDALFRDTMTQLGYATS